MAASASLCTVGAGCGKSDSAISLCDKKASCCCSGIALGSEEIHHTIFFFFLNGELISFQVSGRAFRMMMIFSIIGGFLGGF